MRQQMPFGINAVVSLCRAEQECQTAFATKRTVKAAEGFSSKTASVGSHAKQTRMECEARQAFEVELKRSEFEDEGLETSKPTEPVIH